MNETAARSAEDPLCVLLVDDNRLVRSAVSRTLELGGYRVTATPSDPPPESGRFDVGVFDLHLGEKSGVELARTLLKDGVVRHAVFFTGSMDEHELERAASVGRIIEKTEVRALIAAIDAEASATGTTRR